MCKKVFYYIIVYPRVKIVYAISLEHSCMCVFVIILINKYVKFKIERLAIIFIDY